MCAAQMLARYATQGVICDHQSLGEVLAPLSVAALRLRSGTVRLLDRDHRRIRRCAACGADAAVCGGGRSSKSTGVAGSCFGAVCRSVECTARHSGMAWRYPEGVTERVKAIIQKEFDLISSKKIVRYFLTINDIVCFAREEASPPMLCQEWGSSANSAVCFCLGITAVDPEEHDVLFERFLSEERDEPPDTDVEFGMNGAKKLSSTCTQNTVGSGQGFAPRSFIIVRAAPFAK